jgi:aminoglycoside 6'-N-acetyltransferase
MIYFKPLREVDVKILWEWFQEPTINQLYARGQSWSLTDIENKYLPRLIGKDNVPSFIKLRASIFLLLPVKIEDKGLV